MLFCNFLFKIQILMLLLLHMFYLVDAFNERDETGILGRMNDILGNTLATGQIAIDRGSSNLIGDPSLLRKVDIVGREGTDEFYKSDIAGTSRGSTSNRSTLKPIMQQLNSKAEETSSIHANLWSQSFIDAEHDTTQYKNKLSTLSSGRSVPSSNLGDQLEMVLKLIKLKDVREINRDVFAINIG